MELTHDHGGSAPITPSSAHSPPISAFSSQLHSPSLSRSPLLHSPDHNQPQTTTTTKQKTGHKIAFSNTPPVVSAPPSQMHSPSMSRSPFLGTPDRPVTMPPSGARTPMAYIKSRNLTPRFLTPLGSPLRKALKLTKLDPTDAWLPITESRNGNAYYAAFHTLCSGIGIQALILPVAFTILGWAWGIIALTLAFIWQLYTLYLLVNLHESPETGVRYSRYMQLANATFGERLGKSLTLFPIMYLSAGTCMACIIIGGSTAKIFFQVVCAASECKAETLTTVEWYLVFTCGAVLLSQLPNLNSIAGISLVGAITALGYCTTIWAVSVSQGRLPNVSYNPIRVGSEVSKVFDVLNALGIIAFAFRGHNLILEIQATMPSSEKHPSTVPMWKGVKVSYTLIAMCLFPLAIGGYWAYGHLNGKACLGDIIYRYITAEKFSPDCLLDCLDLSSEHHTLEVANRVEGAIYAWKLKDRKKYTNHPKPKHSSWSGKVKGLVVDGEKNTFLAQRAETLLHSLRLRFPGLPQTSLDMSKIQYNKDVGQSILESYSRVMESLAFNIMARIDDVIFVDDATKCCVASESLSTFNRGGLGGRPIQKRMSPSPFSIQHTPYASPFATPTFCFSPTLICSPGRAPTPINDDNCANDKLEIPKPTDLNKLWTYAGNLTTGSVTERD